MYQLIADYEQTIADLKAQLAGQQQAPTPKLTPQNSSLPPSTQHPHSRPQKGKDKSSKPQKKRGGQPGHPRATRPLIPTEQCDEVIPLVPQGCRKCKSRLRGADPEPLRHQVYELPIIHPIITEYQRHRLTCPGCGTRNCAPLPEGVPTGQAGPRLLAFTGLLMGHFRQSKRRAALFLEDLLNVPCCAATTVKMQRHVSQAFSRYLRGASSRVGEATSTRDGRNSYQAGSAESLALGSRGEVVCRVRDFLQPKSDGTSSLSGSCLLRVSSIAIVRRCIGGSAISNGAGLTSSETSKS